MIESSIISCLLIVSHRRLRRPAPTNARLGLHLAYEIPSTLSQSLPTQFRLSPVSPIGWSNSYRRTLENNLSGEYVVLFPRLEFPSLAEHTSMQIVVEKGFLFGPNFKYAFRILGDKSEVLYEAKNTSAKIWEIGKLRTNLSYLSETGTFFGLKGNSKDLAKLIDSTIVPFTLTYEYGLLRFEDKRGNAYHLGHLPPGEFNGYYLCSSLKEIFSLRVFRSFSTKATFTMIRSPQQLLMRARQLNDQIFSEAISLQAAYQACLPPELLDDNTVPLTVLKEASNEEKALYAKFKGYMPSQYLKESFNSLMTWVAEFVLAFQNRPPSIRMIYQSFSLEVQANRMPHLGVTSALYAICTELFSSAKTESLPVVHWEEACKQLNFESLTQTWVSLQEYAENTRNGLLWRLRSAEVQPLFETIALSIAGVDSIKSCTYSPSGIKFVPSPSLIEVEGKNKWVRILENSIRWSKGKDAKPVWEIDTNDKYVSKFVHLSWSKAYLFFGGVVENGGSLKTIIHFLDLLSSAKQETLVIEELAELESSRIFLTSSPDFLFCIVETPLDVAANADFVKSNWELIVYKLTDFDQPTLIIKISLFELYPELRSLHNIRFCGQPICSSHNSVLIMQCTAADKSVQQSPASSADLLLLTMTATLTVKPCNITSTQIVVSYPFNELGNIRERVRSRSSSASSISTLTAQPSRGVYTGESLSSGVPQTTLVALKSSFHDQPSYFVSVLLPIFVYTLYLVSKGKLTTLHTIEGKSLWLDQDLILETRGYTGKSVKSHGTRAVFVNKCGRGGKDCAIEKAVVYSLTLNFK